MHITRRLGISALAAFAFLFTPIAFGQDQPAEPTDNGGSAFQPEAMAVIERFIQAVGGEENLRKHRYRTVHAEMEIPQAGLKGPFVIHAAAPNLMLVKIEFEGLGEMLQGHDGTVTWSIDPMQGPMILEGAQREQFRRQADFYADLRIRENYKSAEYRGETTFNDTRVHEIRFTDLADKESSSYYCIETHLQVGSRSTAETQMGSIPSTTIMSDYKEFDGIKVPLKVSTRAMQMEQRLTITKVHHERFDREIFELPAEIKTLLAEQKKSEDNGNADS